MNAMHSSNTPDWYTPKEYATAARIVMGGIDLDPASCEEANRTIQAARYLTEKENGLLFEWYGRVFINPPGGKSKIDKQPLVRVFWEHLVQEIIAGRTSEAIWVGYSLDQFQMLQNGKTTVHPLYYPTCIPRKRIAFDAPKSVGEKRHPTHGNYITYIGSNDQAFRDQFSKFGVIIE